MASDLYDGKREYPTSKASISSRATHWKDPKFSKLPNKMHQDPNDTMQSDISDISDIPPTQPIVEHEPKHPSQPSTRTPEAMRQPPESPRHTSEAMKQPESPKHVPEGKKPPSEPPEAAMKQPSEPPKRTSYAPKPTSSTLNDSAFTPLSMRALYYTPDGADSDTPDGIPEGEISDAISPGTSTSIVRQKGTNLIFDPGFPTPQPSPQQYLLKISTLLPRRDPSRRTPQPPKYHAADSTAQSLRDSHQHTARRRRAGRRPEVQNRRSSLRCGELYARRRSRRLCRCN
jgi:hypothetical protein